MPSNLELTQNEAPGPMWQSTQGTRACGELAYVTFCGSMTWHDSPQKPTESVAS